MPPKDKSKAAGISASSFFDLKAELSKKEDEFAKNKAAGKSTQIVGGVKRPDKKTTVWSRQNKGVKDRGAKDVELEAVSKPTIESARAALERKAKIYDKLKKGKTGGLSDKQYDALLVDFDNQPLPDKYESDSDDVDESLSVPEAPAEERDDPLVEYEDEFGRIRTARRSEVPRNVVPEEDVPADDDDVIYNPQGFFPTYVPSAERVKEIIDAHTEGPSNQHYDASREVRAKGAGFYQFSGDEETRRKQMEELNAVREETERNRRETGALDLLPGEVEGMRDGEGPEASGSAGTLKSRALEKRKRELEERRKMVDAKRRKLKGEDPTPTSAPLPSSASPPAKSKTPNAPAFASEADNFLAQLERDMLKTSQ